MLATQRVNTEVPSSYNPHKQCHGIHSKYVHFVQFCIGYADNQTHSYEYEHSKVMLLSI